MTTDKMTPEVQTVLATEATQLQAAMSAVHAYVIHDEPTFTSAGDLLKKAKARWAELEVLRTSITKPINEALRNVNALFKPAQDPYVLIEGVLKGKIAEFTLAQHRAQEQAMRAAAAALQAGQQQAAVAFVAATAPAPTVQGISVKATWDYEIVDADKVPRVYCSPDARKITASLPKEVHEGMAPVVDGIRFFIRGAVRAGK